MAFKVEHAGLVLKMLKLVEAVREEIFFFYSFKFFGGYKDQTNIRQNNRRKANLIV